MEDHVGEDEICKSSLGTDSSKLGFVGRVYLET